MNWNKLDNCEWRCQVTSVVVFLLYVSHAVPTRRNSGIPNWHWLLRLNHKNETTLRGRPRRGSFVSFAKKNSRSVALTGPIYSLELTKLFSLSSISIFFWHFIKTHKAINHGHEKLFISILSNFKLLRTFTEGPSAVRGELNHGQERKETGR